MERKNKSNIHLTILYTLIFIMAVSIVGFTSVFENTNKESSEKAAQEYKIVTPELPDELYFAGEEVPLDNFDVRESLEREIVVNTYWHSASLLNIKKANRWLPVIEEILEENNIPEDFKYMPIVESNLANVISDKGATGYWQLMKDAAKKYGLEVNSIVDERYHVEKSTEAACKYLTEAFEKFGSWTTAAASYNLGMNGMAEQIERQKTNNYYNLVLNEETSRFVFRIVAARELIKNPKKFGFFIDENEMYQPYETRLVKIQMEVKHFADFAREYGINYKTLKLYNPWLRENYLPNKSKKTYEIKIPVEGSIYIIPENE